MVKTGRGKMIDRGNKYPKIHIYLPMGVFKDSAFPFSIGDYLSVTIEGDRLIIEKDETGIEN